MNRIGHGKGYYDHFIQRCYEYAKKMGREPPLLGMMFVYCCWWGSCAGVEMSVDWGGEDSYDWDGLEDGCDHCWRGGSGAEGSMKGSRGVDDCSGSWIRMEWSLLPGSNSTSGPVVIFLIGNRTTDILCVRNDLEIFAYDSYLVRDSDTIPPKLQTVDADKGSYLIPTRRSKERPGSPIDRAIPSS